MATRIQLRYDNAEAWTLANPILAQGEVGIEGDTNKFKFGNGATHWADLPYAVSSSSGSISDLASLLQFAVFRVVGYNVAGSPDPSTQLKIDALTLSGVPLENIDWIDLGEAAAGGLFVVDYSTSAATFDNVVLDLAGGAFVPAGLASAATIGNITLDLNSGLFVVDSATSVSSIDNVTLQDATIQYLVPADFTSSGALDNITLTTAFGVDSMTSDATLDAIVIAQAGGTLAIDSLASDGTLGSITMEAMNNFSVDSLTSAGTIDNVTMTAAATGGPADFRLSSSYATNGSGGDATLTMPTGIEAGDTILVYHSYTGGTPSGWTLLTGDGGGGAWMYKPNCTGSEDGTSVTFATANDQSGEDPQVWYCGIYVFKNVPTSSPFRSYSTSITASNTTPNFKTFTGGALTGLQSGDMHVMILETQGARTLSSNTSGYTSLYSGSIANQVIYKTSVTGSPGALQITLTTGIAGARCITLAVTGT